MAPPNARPKGFASAGMIWRDDSWRVLVMGTAFTLHAWRMRIMNRATRGSVLRDGRVDLLAPRDDAATEVEDLREPLASQVVGHLGAAPADVAVDHDLLAFVDVQLLLAALQLAHRDEDAAGDVGDLVL